MTTAGIASFESTIHATNGWLADVGERLGWVDRHQAYYGLRAVLHALRDRLDVGQAAALGAQLPMLVRGFYYEGWHPANKPLKDRKKKDFLAHVQEAYREDPEVDVERVVRAVFQVLAKHVTAGEVQSIKSTLPAELRELWE